MNSNRSKDLLLLKLKKKKKLLSFSQVWIKLQQAWTILPLTHMNKKVWSRNLLLCWKDIAY